MWLDTIPTGTDPVWMSTRVFCSDKSYSDKDWSEPKMLTDNPDFKVKYSADPDVTADRITKYTGDDESWIAEQPFTWGSDSEIINPIWMITANKNNGIWSD